MSLLERIRTILKREGKLLSIIVRFCQNIFGESTSRNKSTLHLAIHYLLRLTVFALCFLGCFGQIGTILNIFFSFPSIVFVDLYQMERLYLPGMTICNDNRVMRSKLRAYDAKFAAEWNRLLNQSAVRDSKDLKLYQQQLIDNLIRQMMSNLTVSEFMTFGNTADDFFDPKFFRCASDKNGGADKKCILLSNLLTSAQENGNCFTLFHHSQSHELQDIAIASGLSESAVVRGTINESVNIEASLKPFAPNEILRFRVNFREEEYTTLNEPVSGRFTLHDNRQLAVVRERSYLIQPGKYYIFYLTKLTDELLPKPYITDCRDYDKKSEADDQNNNNLTAGNSLFNSPASKNNCIIGCIAKKTVETCNCWPPELPYLYTGIANDTIATLRWCDWREKPPISEQNALHKPGNVTWFQYCFNAHENDCNRACKADCRIDRYRIMKEEMEWPSKERIEHSEEGSDLKALRECCSVISIRYWTAEQKINRYKPRFEIAEFTSYIGGLLSMWLGFSLFGFYNLLERTLIRLWMFIKEKRSRKQQAAKNGSVIDLNTNKSNHHGNDSNHKNEHISLSKNLSIISNSHLNAAKQNIRQTQSNSENNHNDASNPHSHPQHRHHFQQQEHHIHDSETNSNTIENHSTLSFTIRSHDKRNEADNYSRLNSSGVNRHRQRRRGIFPQEYHSEVSLNNAENRTTDSRTPTHVHWLNEQNDNSQSSSPIQSSNMHSHLLASTAARQADTTFDDADQYLDYEHSSHDYRLFGNELRRNFYRHAQPPTPINWSPLIRRHRHS